MYAKRSKPKRVSSAKEKKPFIYTFAIVLNRPLCRRSKVNIRDICYFQRTLGFAHHTVVFIRYTLRSIACILLYMCETYVNRRLTIHRFSCEHELHPNQCVCVSFDNRLHTNRCTNKYRFSPVSDHLARRQCR